MSLWEPRRLLDAFSAALPMRLGFEKRVRGSHHLFRKSGVEEKINLQRAGTNAKPYQVKQVRTAILKAKLGSKP